MADADILQADPEQVIQRLEALRSSLDDAASEIDASERLAALGSITGMFAHELNNILTPVLSRASMALRSPEDAEASRRALEQTVEGVQRLVATATALLGLAREPSDAPQSAGVDASVGFAVDATRVPGADPLVVSVDLRGDPVAAMSPAALQQVLVNLLLNAREAMRGRGGGVHVSACSTWNTELGRPVIELRVADDGPGIRPEDLDRVFEPGRRGRSSRGAGLGLAICKRLVETAGGRIEALSEPGKGGVFRLTLPAAERTAAPRHAA